ncbi:DUF2938 domain-containing protein [Phreatobacter stygius]|uniref:DUF2938 domain-containing protein n=1 Tax=Phreatobacter stygius TaxID=1940610 RepID=A0A4D7BDI6_9HYPH|nr:DUF2938 domain-containing protein [Phreatobacter stygius]QCI66007.1 DUF2938 domain-containing protein [Phreatobacter stygius]
MLDFIYRSLVIGVAATALLDLWALFLKNAFGIPPANWAMVGRWFGHLTRGTAMHEDIAKAEPFPNELTVGWIGHYAVGVLFAAALLLLAGPAWKFAPTAVWPLIVGLVTVGCGWFILQPGMGAGIAASRRPNAGQIRLLNIAGHTVFGLGMFAAAWLIR